MVICLLRNSVRRWCNTVDINSSILGKGEFGILSTNMPSATLDTVPAPLFYFSPPADGSEPYNRVNTDPTSTAPLSNWTPVKHIIQIENVRGKEDSLLLDEAGFQFIKHRSNHTSFIDDEEIKAEYYPESAELIKQLTGASRVVLFDHSMTIYILLILSTHMYPQLFDVAFPDRQTLPLNGSQSKRYMSTRPPHLPQPESIYISLPPKRQSFSSTVSKSSTYGDPSHTQLLTCLLLYVTIVPSTKRTTSLQLHVFLRKDGERRIV